MNSHTNLSFNKNFNSTSVNFQTKCISSYWSDQNAIKIHRTFQCSLSTNLTFSDRPQNFQKLLSNTIQLHETEQSFNVRLRSVVTQLHVILLQIPAKMKQNDIRQVQYWRYHHIHIGIMMQARGGSVWTPCCDPHSHTSLLHLRGCRPSQSAPDEVGSQWALSWWWGYHSYCGSPTVPDDQILL